MPSSLLRGLNRTRLGGAQTTHVVSAMRLDAMRLDPEVLTLVTHDRR